MSQNKLFANMHVTKPAIGLDTFLRFISSKGWTTIIDGNGIISADLGSSSIDNICQQADRVAFVGDNPPAGIEMWPSDDPLFISLLAGMPPSDSHSVLWAGLFDRTNDLDQINLPEDIEKFLDQESRRLPPPQPTLSDNYWVVTLLDCDDSGWSPWNVVAASYEDAVRQARSEWWNCLTDPGPCCAAEEEYCDCRDCVRIRSPAPEVWQVYRGSWLGERVDNKKG